MILIVFVSIPAGVVASLHPGSFFDRLVMLCTSIAISFPDFFISIVLILLFGVFWRVLPMTDYVSPFKDAVGSITHLIMPSFALAAAYIALLSRLVRSDMLDVINEDFVRTARAKGVSGFKVLFKHSLRNSLLPALNLCTLNFAALLGGSIIIESIFALPGVGRLMIKAIYDRDFPLIQGITLLIGFFFLVSSLIADVSGAIIDPRLRKNK